MPLQTTQEALQILNDRTRDVGEREQAIHFLEDHLSPEAIGRLIDALEDEQFGVRWAGAVALIHAGDDALAPLLRALIERPGSVWLREGVHHVFYYNHRLAVRQEYSDLLAALRGPAADVAAKAVALQHLQSMKR